MAHEGSPFRHSHSSIDQHITSRRKFYSDETSPPAALALMLTFQVDPRRDRYRSKTTDKEGEEVEKVEFSETSWQGLCAPLLPARVPPITSASCFAVHRTDDGIETDNADDD